MHDDAGKTVQPGSIPAAFGIRETGWLNKQGFPPQDRSTVMFSCTM